MSRWPVWAVPCGLVRETRTQLVGPCFLTEDAYIAKELAKRVLVENVLGDQVRLSFPDMSGGLATSIAAYTAEVGGELLFMMDTRLGPDDVLVNFGIELTNA